MAGFMDTLFGLNGTPRHVTWPEQALRAGPEYMQRGLEGKYNPQPATPGLLTEEDVAQQDWAKQQMVRDAMGATGSAATGNLALGGALPENAMGALFLKRIPEHLRPQPNTLGGLKNWTHEIHSDAPPTIGHVGNVNAIYRPVDKDLYVRYMRGLGSAKQFDLSRRFSNKALLNNEQAHELGTVTMRSIIDSLRNEFPGVQTVTGWRATGAKSVSKNEKFADDDTVVKIPPAKATVP